MQTHDSDQTSGPIYVSPNAPAGSFDERVSDDEWSLYSNRHGFAESLDQVVRHIQSADSTTSLTFAVYGRWGSGKSTALKYLERSLAPDAEGGRITICRFDHVQQSERDVFALMCRICHEID